MFLAMHCRMFARCEVRKTMCDVVLCFQVSEFPSDCVPSSWHLGTNNQSGSTQSSAVSCRTVACFQFRCKNARSSNACEDLCVKCWFDLFVASLSFSLSLSLMLSISVKTRHRCTCVHLTVCLQTCRAHLITLPTHSRWLKACHKIDFHLTW